MSTEGSWRARLWAKAVALWQRVLSQHASPVRLGWAVGVGVFIACTPLLGLQTLLALLFAYVLRLNRVAVLAGNQVAMPPLTPLVFFIGAQLGERLLHGDWLPVSVEAMSNLTWKEMGPRLFWDMMAGGAVFGVALGAVLGGATFLAARRRQQRAAATQVVQG